MRKLMRHISELAQARNAAEAPRTADGVSDALASSPTVVHRVCRKEVSVFPDAGCLYILLLSAPGRRPSTIGPLLNPRY